MAKIGWIDFSPKDRDRVGSILDLLRPEGQIDELGIGTIRDALSNVLFPGISTIQTRAKYFFIIPYVLQEYLRLSSKERKKVSPTAYLEKREYEVMWGLAEKYEHEEGHGVIGISKFRPEIIVRRPSAIYWAGLNKLGFINSNGLSSATFLNQANKQNLQTHVEALKEKEERDDLDASFENFFRIKVGYKKDWERNLDLELSNSEAHFFKDSIIDKAAASALYPIVDNSKIYHHFTKSNSFGDFAKLVIQENIPVPIREHIQLAHDFAVLMEGAHLAYNQELQMAFFQNDCFQEDWEKWHSNLQNAMLSFNSFNPEHLFVYAQNIKGSTAQFVREWWSLVRAPELDETQKRKLIRTQEAFAKGKKARLRWNKREEVPEGKRIGLNQLEYRFANAKRIVEDIIKGLERDA